MKVTLTVHGTRGDIQPFLALALGLLERGHDVTLAVPPNLLEFVRRCGVRPAKLAVDSQAFLESDAGRGWLASGNVGAFTRAMGEVVHAHRDELIADQLAACDGAEVIVAGALTEDFAAAIAEARGVPLLSLHLAPLRPTSSFPSALVTTRALPLGALNRATHALMEQLWWRGFQADVNVLRARLGLRPARTPTARRLAAAGHPTANAFSPSVVPPPAGWGPLQPIVGALRLPAGARARLGEASPEPALAAWLAAGPPPVYLGLGSMPVRDPDAMLRLVRAVSEACGVRAIVGAGWSRLEAARELPEHVRVVGAVDHGWLLPRCSAAMHHGGAGTTFAALEAGLPAVVASVFADQPFWGTRLERLGVGVHVPFARLDAATLERALRRVLDPAVRAAAARLGATVHAEPDGTPRLVRLVEALRGAERPAAA